MTSFMLLVVVLTIGLVLGEQYTLDFGNPALPFMQNAHGNRFLQAQPDCSPSGSRFLCNIQTEVRTDQGESAVIRASLDCLFSSESVVDFRRASDCRCGAQIFKDGSETPSASCPCTLCPTGFGNSPVNVDCDYTNRPEDQDPFINGPCTSFDCSFACNGTCAFGCENPPPECEELCFGTRSPTAAPTGQAASEAFSYHGSILLVGMLSVAAVLV